jgi:hypothetical protein
MRKIAFVLLLIVMFGIPARGEIRSIDISIFGMD